MNAGAAVLQTETVFHGRYRVLRCIKAGGMGAVYEVLDEATASRRALKVMLPGLLSSDELRARFALEARITGSVESDHIVRTSDAGVDPETQTPFLVMELLRGEELGGLVRKRKALPPQEVALYLFQAALALDKTHDAGIVHRDLKPDNLFVTIRDDGTPCVKILDFGIAKVLERRSDDPATQHMLGTPAYMAPEQIRSDPHVGPRADVHALGHVAYTLLVGESYWSEESDALVSPYLLAAEIMRGPAEPPSQRAGRRRNRALPEAFDAWFFKATATAPDDRFQRASTAIAELGVALGVALPRISRAVLVPEPRAETDAPPPPGAPSDPTVPTGQRRAAAAAMPTTALETPTAEASGRRTPPVAVATSEPTPPPPRSSRLETPARAARADSPTPSRTAAPPESTTPSLRRSQDAVTPSRRMSPPTPSIDPRRADTPALSSRRDRAPQRRFQISVDQVNRILRLKVWGFWDAAEGEAYFEEFLRSARALTGKPWYVLADISEFPAQKPEVNDFVGKTMAFATANGMRKAANLVSSALTRMQIGRLSADTGLPEFSFFQSEAEAVAWLLRND